MRKIHAVLAAAIAVAGLSLTAATAQASGTPTPHHHFYQPPVKTNTFFYTIHDAPPIGTESGYALNDPGGSTEDGQAIQLWSEPDSNEGLEAVFVGTTGGVNFYHLEFANGMCLGVPAGVHQDGQKVIIWTCANSASQNWADASYNGNGQFPVYWYNQTGFNFNALIGYAIDVKGGVNADGTTIQEWYQGTPANEVWVGP